MDFGVTLVFLLLFLLPSASPASTPWWDNNWKHRVVIAAPPSAKQSMIVELHAPQAKQDGSDLRIFPLLQDKQTAWRILHRSDDRAFTLEIALPDASAAASETLPLHFAVYYGNPNASAEAPPTRWNAAPVSVEIHPLVQGQQPETWDEICFLLERSRRKSERQFVAQITPEAIQFDRNRPQLDIYRTTLLCDENGACTFEVDSTGAAFLLIDDALVVSNSGSPRFGRSKASQPTQLSAGAHRVELYHVCTLPAAPVRLSWEPPTTRTARQADQPAQFASVPTATLFTPFRGKLASQETFGEPLSPFFTYTQRGALRVNDVPDEFVTVQFADTTVATGEIVTRAWDFGDGSTSSEQNPTHIFAGTKPRSVSLTVTDDKGRTSQIKRDIEWERTLPVAAQITMELGPMPAVVTPQTDLSVSVTVENLRKREMEVALEWVPTFRGNRNRASQGARAGESAIQESAPVHRTSLNLGVEDSRSLEIRLPSVSTLEAVSFVLRYSGVVISRELVHLRKPDELREPLALDGHLMNKREECVILLADPIASRAEAWPGFPKRIVCLDDTLCGSGAIMDGGKPFAETLESALKIPVHHLAWNTEARSSKGVPTLYKFTQLDGIPLERGDLAVVSLGLPDLDERVTPANYENQIIFIADYLRLVKGANVLLVTPPPVPADAEASRTYAKRIMEIGREKNIPVLDLYSLMSIQRNWEIFYRDDGGLMASDSPASYLFYPNANGQRWIAEELARMISKWKQ